MLFKLAEFVALKLVIVPVVAEIVPVVVTPVTYASLADTRPTVAIPVTDNLSTSFNVLTLISLVATSDDAVTTPTVKLLIYAAETVANPTVATPLIFV